MRTDNDVVGEGERAAALRHGDSRVQVQEAAAVGAGHGGDGWVHVPPEARRSGRVSGRRSVAQELRVGWQRVATDPTLDDERLRFGSAQTEF